MTPRVLRHRDRATLVEDAAQSLLEVLVRLQSEQEVVHLCLTSEGVATDVLARFADLVPDSALDTTRLHLWWSDEAFVSTTDPQRLSVQALAVLGRTLHLASSQTHLIPASDGRADPSEAGYAYAAELGETVFDVCVLGMGDDGHVASLFPDGPVAEGGSSLVVGLDDAPVEPHERITLTYTALNRSQQVWFWVDGAENAQTVARAVAGDQSLPAARVRGRLQTLLFLDEASAAELPQYHCSL